MSQERSAQASLLKSQSHCDVLNARTSIPRGGHFMAWEEPELYVEDIVDFTRQLRNS